ncbi:hypothetical protein [Streptomyces sp. NBC_00203]|uniref:hypothetical protein n=1 Tax=Streptomyces sp. NBC_00203 TaxID=2975680 RepID=UPI00324F298A
MATRQVDALSPFAGLESLAWGDLDQVRERSDTLFDALVQDDCQPLRKLLAALADTPGLPELSGRVDSMRKLVVWRSPADAVRLRLHLFTPGYQDRPHDHRFAFATRILSGAYVHRGYRRTVLDPDASSAERTAESIRVEQEGSGYVMGPDAVHSLTACRPTLTLMLRGPIVKRSATIVEQATGERFQLRGAADASSAQSGDGRLEPVELLATVAEMSAALPGSGRPGSRGAAS